MRSGSVVSIADMVDRLAGHDVVSLEEYGNTEPDTDLFQILEDDEGNHGLCLHGEPGHLDIEWHEEHRVLRIGYPKSKSWTLSIEQLEALSIFFRQVLYAAWSGIPVTPKEQD